MAAQSSEDPPIRVLALARDAGYSGLGGAEVMIMDVLHGLDAARFRSVLCTTRLPEPHRREAAHRETADLRRARVEVVNLGRTSSRAIRPWGRLWRLMRRGRFDVVHAHMPRAAVPGAVLARLAGVPVVIVHEHGSVLYGTRLRRLLNHCIVDRLSDVVLAVSDWDRRHLIERDGLSAARVRVLPNGIRPLPESDRSVRAELLGDGALLIGAIGRLATVKGFDDLITAIAQLRGRWPGVRLVIAGAGPEEQRLRALITELDLGRHVRLLGARGDVPAILHALDVAVMSSHSEGAPLALLEYMAAGRAIVATRVGGIPELVRDGIEGLLVEPHAPVDLAATLERVLEDHELRRRLGDAARQRQRERYSQSAVVRELESLYVTTLELAGGRRYRLPVRT